MTAIRYARAGDTHVAYQLLEGEGDHDVVMVSGFFFPIESLAEDPVVARLLEGLRGLGRLVVFDRRGVGLSDPITDWERPLADQWSDDLAAVIAAAGLNRPVIFAWDLIGVARRFATRFPDAADRLVLLAPLPPPSPAGDEWHDQIWDEERVLQEGEGDHLLERAFPTRVTDPTFRTWLDRAGRQGASPTLAARMNDAHATQLRAHPTDHSLIRVPTLVLRRPSSGMIPPALVGRVASLIENAELVDLPGPDELVVGPDVDALLAEVTRFVTGEAWLPPPERMLSAVLFSDLVGSTERAAAAGDARWKVLLDSHDAAARRVIGRCGGRVVKTTGDGVLATLPAASSALAAANEIKRVVCDMGLAVRIGIHVGDIERRGDDVAGLAIHVASRVMAAAAAGEVLVSHTVPPAVIGAGVCFETRGLHALKGVPGEWELSAALDGEARLP